MIYLKNFEFACAEAEEAFLNGIRRTCYDTFYPFGVLGEKEIGKVEFEPLTIFYGGNGSGKTTAINIIAELLGAKRESLFNCSDFYGDYLNLCDFEIAKKPEEVSVITSDDVFDFMLNIRSLNDGIDMRRSQLFDEYMDKKHSEFRLKSLEDYEELKKVVDARRLTQSKFVRKNLAKNVSEHSNGESAYIYFTNKIKENGLYLLDEPENSLSPENQIELSKFIENSIRFFGCQIIMATHSPFMLALKGARIYDLDETPVMTKQWTKLKNVRTYFNFFMNHRKEFER